MKKTFINRKQELEKLRKMKDLRSPPFIVIVGRRRIGKTRLVQEFLNEFHLACINYDSEEIKRLLSGAVSGYSAEEGIVDPVWNQNALIYPSVTSTDDTKKSNKVSGSSDKKFH